MPRRLWVLIVTIVIVAYSYQRADVHLLLGYLAERLHMMSMASAAYDRSVQIDPGYEQAHLGILRLLKPLDRCGSLQPVCNAARRGTESSEKLEAAIAGACIQCGFVQDAFIAYENCLRVQPESETCLYGRGLALSLLGDYALAVEVYRDALSRHQASELILLGLSYALLQLHEYDEARAYAEMVLSQNPDSSLAQEYVRLAEDAKSDRAR